MVKVIDADGAILGRLASSVAKRLLEGESIVIVNAEKAVVSGDPKIVTQQFMKKRKRGDRFKGPFYPRYPDRIIKRVVRGMLPYKKKKGRDALSSLKVYMGVPDDIKLEAAEKVSKSADRLRCKYIKLAEISKFLGAKIGE